LSLRIVLVHYHFNQLCSNKGKIVPEQVVPHEAEIDTTWMRCATVAVGKPKRQMRKASHCGSKQQ